jgi:hypothetical protein
MKWVLRTFCSPPAGCPLSRRLAREAPRGLTLRPRLNRGLLVSRLGGQTGLAKTEIPLAKIIKAVSLCRAGGWSTFPITSTGKPANGRIGRKLPGRRPEAKGRLEAEGQGLKAKGKLEAEGSDGKRPGNRKRNAHPGPKGNRRQRGSRD